MADPIIDDPVPGEAAFGGRRPAAVWSKAAQILGLARQLGGDARFLDDYAPEVERLDIPRLEAGGAQLDLRMAEARERYLLGPAIAQQIAQPFAAAEVIDRVQQQSWHAARSDQDPGAAASILFLGLFHPDEVIRLVAAASYARFSTAPPAFLIDLLAEGCFSESETLAALSANALSRIQPLHPLLDLMAGGDDGQEPREPGHTSVTVHGTWARWRRRGLPVARWVREQWRGRETNQPRWWEPGGDLHSYLLAGIAPDLYGGADHFRWSGGHRRRLQVEAAQDLQEWCAQRGTARLRDVYAHSHGGTVALRAANLGQEMTLLVLMSVPPLRDGVDWGNVGRAVSIRSHFDLVLALDLSPRWHPDPVRELDLPVWFGHGVTHDPEFWERNDLPNQINYERGFSHLP